MEVNLGEVPNGDYRDAIHVAVITMVAGEMLAVGHPFELRGDATFKSERGQGIVDPFLEDEYILKGTIFWGFLWPKTVTGMQHRWTHPAFDKEAHEGGHGCSDPEGVSKRWLEEMCRDVGVSWEDFEYVYVEDGYVHMGSDERYNNIPSGGAEFLKHFKNVFGKEPSEDGYFSCSC